MSSESRVDLGIIQYREDDDQEDDDINRDD